MQIHPFRKEDKFCLAHSFIVIASSSFEQTELVKANLSVDRDLLVHRVDARVVFAYRPRQAPAPDCYFRNERSNTLSLILGDESGPSTSSSCLPSGYAASIHVNFTIKQIRAHSSLVGLPPLFLYQDASRLGTVLTSSWTLLRLLDDCNLCFDTKALGEVCEVGYPLGHRTLFRNVRILPAGHEATLDHGRLLIKQRWNLPDRQDPECELAEYTTRQIEAFVEAVNSINLEGGFLSLTAGLDSRAIFSGLMRRNGNIPARTLTGESNTLDATTAKDLCRTYGVDHEVVPLDETFRRELPLYTAKASLLSGGLAGLEEAHEVYFHETVSRQFRARISGNFGNQLGRHGVERISGRGARPTFFHPDLLDTCFSTKRGGVKGRNADATACSEVWLLLRQTLFANIANYCIGSSYCVQRSPYATRRLIELLPYRPRCLRFPNGMNYWTLRAAQVRHLFLGEPLQQSFQRRLIAETGGFIASCPVNWGWRPQGGISWQGLWRGILACGDVFSYKLPTDVPLVHP